MLFLILTVLSGLFFGGSILWLCWESRKDKVSIGWFSFFAFIGILGAFCIHHVLYDYNPALEIAVPGVDYELYDENALQFLKSGVEVMAHYPPPPTAFEFTVSTATSSSSPSSHVSSPSSKSKGGSYGGGPKRKNRHARKGRKSNSKHKHSVNKPTPPPKPVRTSKPISVWYSVPSISHGEDEDEDEDDHEDERDEELSLCWSDNRNRQNSRDRRECTNKIMLTDILSFSADPPMWLTTPSSLSSTSSTPSSSSSSSPVSQLNTISGRSRTTSFSFESGDESSDTTSLSSSSGVNTTSSSSLPSAVNLGNKRYIIIKCKNKTLSSSVQHVWEFDISKSYYTYNTVINALAHSISQLPTPSRDSSSSSSSLFAGLHFPVTDGRAANLLRHGMNLKASYTDSEKSYVFTWCTTAIDGRSVLHWQHAYQLPSSSSFPRETEDNSLYINDISEIYIGADTGVFRFPHAVNADGRLCLSISTKSGQELNLEMQTEAQLFSWLSAIQHEYVRFQNGFHQKQTGQTQQRAASIFPIRVYGDDGSLLGYHEIARYYHRLERQGFILSQISQAFKLLSNSSKSARSVQNLFLLSVGGVQVGSGTNSQVGPSSWIDLDIAASVLTQLTQQNSNKHTKSQISHAHNHDDLITAASVLSLLSKHAASGSSSGGTIGLSLFSITGDGAGSPVISILCKFQVHCRFRLINHNLQALREGISSLTMSSSSASSSTTSPMIQPDSITADKPASVDRSSPSVHSSPPPSSSLPAQTPTQTQNMQSGHRQLSQQHQQQHQQHEQAQGHVQRPPQQHHQQQKKQQQEEQPTEQRQESRRVQNVGKNDVQSTNHPSLDKKPSPAESLRSPTSSSNTCGADTVASCLTKDELAIIHHYQVEATLPTTSCDSSSGSTSSLLQTSINSNLKSVDCPADACAAIEEQGGVYVKTITLEDMQKLPEYTTYIEDLEAQRLPRPIIIYKYQHHHHHYYSDQDTNQADVAASVIEQIEKNKKAGSHANTGEHAASIHHHYYLGGSKSSRRKANSDLIEDQFDEDDDYYATWDPENEEEDDDRNEWKPQATNSKSPRSSTPRSKKSNSRSRKLSKKLSRTPSEWILGGFWHIPLVAAWFACLTYSFTVYNIVVLRLFKADDITRAISPKWNKIEQIYGFVWRFIPFLVGIWSLSSFDWLWELDAPDLSQGASMAGYVYLNLELGSFLVKEIRLLKKLKNQLVNLAKSYSNRKLMIQIKATPELVLNTCLVRLLIRDVISLSDLNILICICLILRFHGICQSIYILADVDRFINLLPDAIHFDAFYRLGRDVVAMWTFFMRYEPIGVDKSQHEYLVYIFLAQMAQHLLDCVAALQTLYRKFVPKAPKK